MRKTDDNKFGAAIREARQRLKLSLQKVGVKLRKDDGTPVSPQYLNDLEHGRRNPPDEKIVAQMAKVLDIDPDTLLSLAGKGPVEVQEYLDHAPEERGNIGRLFRKAKEAGFTDWDALEKQIDGGGRKR